MASKRSQITMTDDEVQAYLESERVLNVATIGPNGYPHLVAMWFAMVDGNPVFWTFGKSQKIVNLRRDSKMTGLVESGDSYDQLRGVELRGEAALPFLEAQATKRIGVVFEIEHVASWDHTKLAGSH